MSKYYYVMTTVRDLEAEYDMPSVMKIDSKIDVVKNHDYIEEECIRKHWDSDAEHRIEDGWYLPSYSGNREIYLSRFKPVSPSDYKVLSKYIFTWEHKEENNA